jgi:hypothetical protein
VIELHISILRLNWHVELQISEHKACHSVLSYSLCLAFCSFSVTAIPEAVNTISECSSQIDSLYATV